MSKLQLRVCDLDDVNLVDVFKELDSKYENFTDQEQRVWSMVFIELYLRNLITVDDNDDVVIKEETKWFSYKVFYQD